MYSVIILVILLCISYFAVTALHTRPDVAKCRRKFLVNNFSSGVAIVTVVPTVLTAEVVDALIINDNNVEEAMTAILPLSIESAAARFSSDDDADNHSLLKIILYPDPSLRQTASPVSKLGTPELEKVVSVLIKGMKSNATTAIQYGIDARIIILKGNASPDFDAVSPAVFVNPNILSRSNEYSMVPWREYCPVVTDVAEFSLDNNNDHNKNNNVLDLVEVNLLRDEIIEIAAQNYLTGRPIRKSLRGESARAFQHELYHLDGILIVDHADLNELPTYIANLEAPYHTERQRRAYQRNTFQGNTPLYY